MKQKRRKVSLVVLSDIHLGTYGCHAKELNSYLKSIQPKYLILNGDIIDIWQFSKKYWPKSHMKVVKQILNLAAKGTKVYYLTGNHDELLRKFEGIELGNFHLLNKLELDLDGKKALFFHGDVFDVVIQYSKWLAKLGAISYDFLILVNVAVNKVRQFFGKSKLSLSKRIKDNVKTAVKYINNFEQTAAEMAISKGYDYIVCGHIHQPQDKIIQHNAESIRYLNSGDWVENLSALEYDKKNWSVYEFKKDHLLNKYNDSSFEDQNELTDMNNKELFERMLDGFITPKS
ncbi:MAG: UDP-2,3-diacylglucosamine diphosphatase [Flavobacteriaceae bacterium]